MRKVHGWRRVARWVIGILGGLLGLVALVVVVAFIVFQTGWGRGILRDQIEARLDTTFVGGGTLGSVEGNPLSQLVLNDLVINGPDKRPAVTIKRLTIKVPLLPLISHQIRVDKIIAEQLDIRATKLASGDYQLQHMTKPSKPSTWSISLPDVEVRRGHVYVEQGRGEEPIDIDNLNVTVDAAMPFAGPLDASVMATGTWRQKNAPISLGAVVHGDTESFEVRNAGVQLADVRVVALGVKLPKGEYSKPFAGSIAVHAPARTVHDIFPTVHLPDDIALAVTARAEGRLTYFTLRGALGDRGEFTAFGNADVQARLANIVVSAADLELGKLTNGRLSGRGGALATLEIDGATQSELPTAGGVITAWTTMPNAPPLSVLVAIHSHDDLVRATVGATSGSGVLAGLGAVVRKRGGELTLERGDLVARTLDVRRATMGAAPLRGVLSARLHAEGKLAPTAELAIAGHANGRNLRMQDMRADRLAFRINAKHVPARPVGSGRVELMNFERADLKFAKLTIAAGNRPDGKLQVSVRSQPKPAPWRVDLDALVTTGETTIVDLQRHFVRASGGSTWRGAGGRVLVGPRKIEVRGLASASEDGKLVANATYVRAGRDKGDLAAQIDASVMLGRLTKGHKGRVEAHVDLQRENNRFNGVVTAKGTGISLDPKSPFAFDGDIKIEARDKQVVANAQISTTKAGAARVALDVDAPADITNVRAWRKLGRTAIRTAQLTLDGIDLEQVAKMAKAAPMKGRIDGTIDLSPTDAKGAISIRGVQTKQTKDLGTINADLQVSQTSKAELKTTLTGRLVPDPRVRAAKDATQDGTARLSAEASFTTPERIFDPAAWQRLGAGAFQGGSLRAERFAFQPGTLERLGILTQLRGELGVGAEIEAGMRSLRFAVNLHGLRGGVLAQPVAVNIVGAIDKQSTRTHVHVRHQGITLLHLSAEVPLSIDEIRANPQSAKTAPLAARARIEHIPAKTLMNVLGTSQIQTGTLDGTIELAGTVSKPTLDAKLIARDVSVPQAGREQIQQIKQLTIAATWDGARGNLAIDGKQTAGGTLKIRAQGAPTDLDKVSATIFASKVDIAPLVAFMPGPAGGLGGRLEADFTLRGANPKTADLAGTLRISDGRIPIAPAVGTLFQGDLRIDVRERVFGMTMTGKLGRGDVRIAASAPLEGVTPKNGRLKVRLRKVQLIGKTEPILSGVIDADLARIGDTWRSNVRVHELAVKVPKEKGNELSPVGAPPDLVYGGEKIHHGKHKGKDVPRGIVKDTTGPADFKPPSQVESRDGEPKRKLPGDPALVAYVDIKNVFVESDEVRGLVGGKLTLSVADNKEVGIVGNLALSRGVLDLFNRRYQVDKAALAFDGSPDPMLDVRITHDFPEVTTITEVRGRMSDPELILSSEPGRYSQAELLGFLLGGEPNSDPEMAPSASERVAGAGASFISNKIGGYVKKALPVDVDVLRYEAASAHSSAAVTVGTWITDTLFLAYRRHLEARPDENAGEGEVEYWLRRRLVLEGVVGDRGVNGLDLLWRRRW